MSEYTKLSLKRELMDLIQKFIEDYPEEGYRSLAQFVEDATRRRAEALHVSERTPRFEHFNLKEDHITLEDKKLTRWVEVYYTPEGKLRCDNCDSFTCEHVKATLKEPKPMKELAKRGWKYRE